MNTTHEYYCLRASLLDVKPPIWRQLLIRESATFMDLHEALQESCGWENRHLFAFHESLRGPVIAGIPDDEFSPPTPDAGEETLTGYFRSDGATTCYYLYDFGDDWWHEVKLEKVIHRNQAFKRELLDGARSFPPEDCGGTPGYEDCLAVLSGRAANGDTELAAWLGDWSPERFDLGEVKAQFDE